VNISFLRWLASAFVVCTLTILLHGCVTGGGYYTDEGATYYEHYGAAYGNWGPEYHVAPYRDRDHDHDRGYHPRGGDRLPSERAFRSAPASRPVPSIPSQPRSGGSHQSGSHPSGSHPSGSHSGDSHSR